MTTSKTPKQSKVKKAITEYEAKARLWELGELSWKLKGKQINIYNHFKKSEQDIDTCLISRQFGKSYTLLVLVTEACIRNPNTIVKYACPKQKMVERVIRPRMRDICIDAPRHLAPEWIPSEKVFRFPNGSEIQVAGTDNGHYDSLRGGTAHLCVVDEAGFCDELETIVYSVLAPTTDTTNGKIWLASTPNDEDPAHDFHEFFVNPMKASGSLLEMTFYDSPMLDDKKRQKIIDRYPGGEANIKFRCEYLVEIPRATESTVIPEFYANRDSIIIKEYTLPPFYDAYVSMDVGFKDLTAALFAYYDFNEACLYIIDEIITNGPEMTTQSLATDIKHKERIHFIDPLSSEIKTPYMRVMDNDLKLINDLARLHELYFIPTAKDKKEVAINQLRMWLSNGRIKIHERCKHTIYHLENVLWTKNRSEFARLKDSPNSDIRGGHADAADAAIYMVRAINEYNCPYPDNFGQLKGPTVHHNPSKNENTSSIKELMKKLMNLK